MSVVAEHRSADVNHVALAVSDAGRSPTVLAGLGIVALLVVLWRRWYRPGLAAAAASRPGYPAAPQARFAGFLLDERSLARRRSARRAFSTLPASMPAERYGRLMQSFPRDLRQRLWTDDARHRIGELRTAGQLLGPQRASGISGLQLTDVDTYLPDDLLYKADIASMANSLELRAPLLDYELAELALGLPDHLRLDGSTGKVALRRAFASDLPPEILDRGKAGFGVPVARWFREELRDLAGDVLLGSTARGRGPVPARGRRAPPAEHTDGAADHGERIWALVMLELWQERYGDDATPA